MLFLAQGFEEYEASVFTDVLGWSGTYGFEPLNLVTVGLRTPVHGAWNFVVTPNRLLNGIVRVEFDALAIPGGLRRKGFYEDAYDERFLDLIREFNQQEKVIASVCVGALPIGKSGALQNRMGTTYFGNGRKRQQQLSEFGVIVQHKAIVVDHNIITSTSPATALDVAFQLLEMLTSQANVLKVKEGMGFISESVSEDRKNCKGEEILAV
jgi:4-methyl-5(b-hydroxyethyl)-thiazole monophosphate biosynthesis